MAYTSEGRRKRNNLDRASRGEGMMDYIREEMAKLPSMIIERVKETGAGVTKKGGGAKAFSIPYSSRWARERRKKSLQTSKKDFSFSNSMWDTFVLKSERISFPTITFTYGVAEGKQTDKADAHGEREGTNILYPNGDEMDELQANVQIAINRYLNDILK